MVNFQFAANFMKHRKQLQVIQEDIARHVGCQGRLFRNGRRGKAIQILRYCQNLRHFFNISIDELLGMSHS